MKIILVLLVATILTEMTFAGVDSSAEERLTIQTDMKFVCQIMKMEKVLAKDKSIDSADLTERILSMQYASLRSDASKKTYKSTTAADPQTKMELWKNFKETNKITGIDCF